MRIIILSDQPKFSRNFHDFYPLYKWQRKLYEDGFHIDFYYHHKALEGKIADVFIISTRYPFNLRSDFITLFNTIKKPENRIALFDASDTSGIVDFDLIPFVDAFIKKQVLKDLDFYTFNKQDISVRPWLPNLPSPLNYADYRPCPKKELHKIKTGWNLGLCDYRYFPSYTGLARNFWITALPDRKTTAKHIFTAYRGTVNYNNREISFQRNRVLEILTGLPVKDIVLGGRVNKSQYLRELQQSKIGISPFGFGEICYRDFETIYKGCLLIKPSMDHLNTFPDIYQPGKTFIEIGWDISGLEEKLLDIEKNYTRYQSIAENAYEVFMSCQNNYELFSTFFKSLIHSL